MYDGITIDSLYEAFMDIDEFGDPTDPTPFAEDIFKFFGKETLGGYLLEAWEQEYGTYLPAWDPAQINLAGRMRDLDYKDAMDTLKTTKAATERVYATEMDTLSSSLGRELGKGKEIASRIGLRSGGTESAVQEVIATTESKAKDFGDITRIANQKAEDKYNTVMVDTALDFDQTERDEKQAFYDRTMAMIMKLMDKGAFDDSPLVEGQIGLPEGWGRQELIMSGKDWGSYIPYTGDYIYLNGTYYFYHHAVEGNQSGYMEISIDDANWLKENEGRIFFDDPNG